MDRREGWGPAQIWGREHLPLLLQQSWQEGPGPQKNEGIPCSGIRGAGMGDRLAFQRPIGAQLSQSTTVWPWGRDSGEGAA